MGPEGGLVHMQPPWRGGLIVGRQHIDGIKRCQQLIGAQQELKHLSTHMHHAKMMMSVGAPRHHDGSKAGRGDGGLGCTK